MVLESHSLPIENQRIETWFQEAENRVPDSQPASQSAWRASLATYFINPVAVSGRMPKMGLKAKNGLESHSLPITNQRIETWFQEAENRMPDSQPASQAASHGFLLQKAQ